MKAGHDITVDRERAKDPTGGAMAGLDPVGMGRVQLLRCPPGDNAQAIAGVDELMRLSRLDPDWDWAGTAIVARKWQQLGPVRAYAERLGIPVQMANESLPSIWRLREMQHFISALRRHPAQLPGSADLPGFLKGPARNRWTDLIGEGIAALECEIAGRPMPVPDLVEWFAEWARNVRGQQNGLLLLTAHRAKGLEFDHVVILDGDWAMTSGDEDADAPRRLFYVAMTRARRSLAVISTGAHPFLAQPHEAVLHRSVTPETGPTRSGRLPDNTPHRRVCHDLIPDMSLVDLSWAGVCETATLRLQPLQRHRPEIRSPCTTTSTPGPSEMRTETHLRACPANSSRLKVSLSCAAKSAPSSTGARPTTVMSSAPPSAARPGKSCCLN